MMQKKGHYLEDAEGIKCVAGFCDLVPFLGLTGKFHVALTFWRARLKAGGSIVITDTIAYIWGNKSYPYQIERSEHVAAQPVSKVSLRRRLINSVDMSFFSQSN